MTDLVQNLVSQLGVNQGQAEGGLGLIAKLAQEKLSDGDFSTLTSKVPGLLEMVSKAPQFESGGAGLGNLAGMAMSALGAENAGGLAQLVSGFSQLGVDADTVAKFAPIVMSYFDSQGGDAVSQIIKKFL